MSKRSMSQDSSSTKKGTVHNLSRYTSDDHNGCESFRVRPTPMHGVETLEDLLDLAWNHTGSKIDSFRLWKMIPSLTDLSLLIGMEKIKQSIVSLILTYLQDLHKLPDGTVDEQEMLHTVISSGPGTGKTTVATILARIYCDLGAVPTAKVTKVKRSDLIGKFIGHTEKNTKKALEDARGGILFIDEAYSLGQAERIDSFSKAALDMLTSFLSETPDCICIIAGYPDELDSCFFRINQGLARRFTRRMEIDPYTGPQLFQIFNLSVRQNLWKLSNLIEPTKDPTKDPTKEGNKVASPTKDPTKEGLGGTKGLGGNKVASPTKGEKDLGKEEVNKTEMTKIREFFDVNVDKFPYAGGDVVALFGKCKEAHSRRIFGTNFERRNINMADVELGFKMFCEGRKIKVKEPVVDESKTWETMFV